MKTRPVADPANKKPYVVHEPEKAIQKRILDWLGRTGLLHWRQNSGWAFAGKRMIRLGPEGLPDVIVIIGPHGKFLGLEIKSATGQLRPSQEEFCEKATKAGAMYRVVRSLEQAQDAVAQALGEEQWSALRPSLVVPPRTPRKRPTRSRRLKPAG